MGDNRDMDPNVDEHEYTGADPHPDNPNPDADGDATDPEAPGPTADVVDPDAD